MQFFNYTFLPIGNFTKSFCGFTSRKAVFAREEALKLRILTVQDGTATQLLSFTKVMTSDFLPRTPSFPDTLELRKLLTAQVCTPKKTGRS